MDSAFPSFCNFPDRVPAHVRFQCRTPLFARSRDTLLWFFGTRTRATMQKDEKTLAAY